jgi:hypothetical protein
MAITSGSFNATLPPDLTKEVVSYVVGIPSGAGVAQAVTPAIKAQAVTVFNATANLLRCAVTFSAGIVSAGVAATRTFLVPAGGSFSVDFANHEGDNAVGAIDAITGISLIAVQPGTVTAEASTLVASTAAVAGLAYVNLASA